MNDTLEEKIEKHDTLNPKLWDIKTNKLLPEVREKIEEIVNTFLDTLEEDGIKIIPDDVILIGSNAGYNYNENSDLDIHIVANTEDLDCPDNLYPLLYSAYRSMFNSKYDITLHGIPAEIYVETEGMPRVSDGVYSVKEDKWIKEPKQKDVPEINQDKFQALFDKWQDKIDDLLSRKDELSDEQEIVDLINDIYKLRQQGLKMKDAEFAIPNLVFKEIRSLGELDELKDLKDKVMSKRLSLESLKHESFGDYDKQRQLNQALGIYKATFNGDRFTVPNVKYDDTNDLIAKIDRLSFVDSSTTKFIPGKFDLSKFTLDRPKRLYTLVGEFKHD